MLIWNSIPTSLDSAADVVVGQANMTASSAIGATARWCLISPQSASG